MANHHTRTQQEFIVRKLAALEPPREIVRNFAAVFPDTKCDENDVRRLDPANVPLPFELFTIFQTERKRIKDDPDSAPFADKKLRLVVLDKYATMYDRNNQPAEVRSVFRQILEETEGTIKGAKAPAVAEDVKKLVAITRTVVDPAPPEAPAA